MSIYKKKGQVVHQLMQFNSKEERFRFLVRKAESMPKLHDSLKLDKFKVTGCISRVWLIPELRNSRIFLQADSDALLVKGVLGILVDIYSDNLPESVLDLHPGFLEEVGITLSVNRRNSLSNFYKQICLYAAAYAALNTAGINNQKPV